VQFPKHTQAYRLYIVVDKAYTSFYGSLNTKCMKLNTAVIVETEVCYSV